MQNIKINKIKNKFYKDPKRVILKLHLPNEKHTESIIRKVLQIDEKDMKKIISKTFLRFEKRHKNIKETYMKHYKAIRQFIPLDVSPSEEQKILLGLYFTCEYSLQGAAFFNPSIVAHPDQSGIKKSSLRFILSFRSVGEGHISSIEFRSGVVDENGIFCFDETSQYAETPKVIKNPSYHNGIFRLKLKELGYENEIADKVLNTLPEFFCFSDLSKSLKKFPEHIESNTIKHMLWLAKSNQELKFNSDQELSERVIFPYSDENSNGVEDARFVKFKNCENETVYYATYTAYNGFKILPQLLETRDFLSFKIVTLNGEYIKDKGMALFPRKINKKYWMLSRYDGNDLYLSSSENIHFWNEATILRQPKYLWELFQIGNCGSPIETEKGWLVITHGVGPMREYSIGAILLDLNDPSKIIGELKEPILIAKNGEANGYVPNVVYSCGSLIHKDNLIVPYAMSDTFSTIASFSLSEILEGMRDIK